MAVEAMSAVVVAVLEVLGDDLQAAFAALHQGRSPGGEPVGAGARSWSSGRGVESNTGYFVVSVPDVQAGG